MQFQLEEISRNGILEEPARPFVDNQRVRCRPALANRKDGALLGTNPLQNRIVARRICQVRVAIQKRGLVLPERFGRAALPKHPGLCHQNTEIPLLGQKVASSILFVHGKTTPTLAGQETKLLEKSFIDASDE